MHDEYDGDSYDFGDEYESEYSGVAEPPIPMK
jgi:hypothetical protein